MSAIGPWFKCYPDAFIGGLVGLNCDETAFYLHLVLRMYDAGDAIYADDKTIARWCGSNARKWLRVRESLIAKRKLIELSDGGLINERALLEMSQFAAERRSIPKPVCRRLDRLLEMFEQSLAKDSRKISQTVPENSEETRPLRETRSEKLEVEADASTIPTTSEQSSLEERDGVVGVEADGTIVSETVVHLDPRKRCWAIGPSYIKRYNGEDERKARSLVGKLIKETGPKQALRVLQGLYDSGTQDPVGYIGGAIRRHKIDNREEQQRAEFGMFHAHDGGDDEPPRTNDSRLGEGSPERHSPHDMPVVQPPTEEEEFPLPQYHH